MTTLADAILALAKNLTDVVESSATGGSTTTLVDSSRTEPADYFDNGTIWFLSGDNAGKSVKISAWALDTTTFTFAAQAAAVEAAVRYAAAPADYPRYLLIQAVNEALRSLGMIPDRDTSLTTVADQEAYDLPAGVYNLKRVEIATETTAPLKYKPHFNWREIVGQLVFDTDHAPDDDGYTLRLTYEAPPTELTADSDTISSDIHLDLLAWKAAVHALRWRMTRTEGKEAYIISKLNEARQEAIFQTGLHPVPRMNRDPHLGAW